MDEPSTLSTVLDALARAARALWAVRWSHHLVGFGRLAAVPLRLLWLPLSWAASLLLVLLAPALYIMSYVLSWAGVLVALIVGLEPLYTFFGVAAAVGIVSGVALGLASTVITSYLGMHDGPDTDERLLPKLEKNDLDFPTTLPAVVETDWYWPGSPSSRHRRPSGLLSQTIHEEDDDSDL